MGLQGPGGVANLHVQTAIDEASGKLTMLYQARPFRHSLQEHFYYLGIRVPV